YQYLACIGPITLVSIATGNWSERFKEIRPFILTLAAIVVVTLAVLSWRQSSMYGDIEGLWRSTLAKNRDCWMAHNNLGIVLFQKGQIDEAVAHYRTTLSLEPNFWDAAYNLGNALLKKGEVDEALVYCSRAVMAQPNDPDARVAVANALLAKGRVEEAI